jgi:hypothetical protein
MKVDVPSLSQFFRAPSGKLCCASCSFIPEQSSILAQSILAQSMRPFFIVAIFSGAFLKSWGNCVSQRAVSCQSKHPHPCAIFYIVQKVSHSQHDEIASRFVHLKHFVYANFTVQANPPTLRSHRRSKDTRRMRFSQQVPSLERMLSDSRRTRAREELRLCASIVRRLPSRPARPSSPSGPPAVESKNILITLSPPDTAEGSGGAYNCTGSSPAGP